MDTGKEQEPIVTEPKEDPFAPPEPVVAPEPVEVPVAVPA